MKVAVVELRATGLKLTPDELRDAPEVSGELFLEGGQAVLCAGPHPDEWPEHGRALPPLYYAAVTRIRGDSFVITGRYLRDGIMVHAEHPQAWWCRLAPSPEPDR